MAGGLVCLALAPIRAPWGAHAFFTCLAAMALIPPASALGEDGGA
ncbi:MAG: hypothetical protein AB1426_03300 [Bacillota bacterium]